MWLGSRGGRQAGRQAGSVTHQQLLLVIVPADQVATHVCTGGVGSGPGSRIRHEVARVSLVWAVAGVCIRRWACMAVRQMSAAVPTVDCCAAVDSCAALLIVVGAGVQTGRSCIVGGC